MMPAPAVDQRQHHGIASHLLGTLAWLRGTNTASHVAAANTALDRVDHALDRLDEVEILVTSHLEQDP